MDTRAYRSVKVERGPNGWGGPLTIRPTPERDKIVAVTGGSIPELARLLAELTGGTLVDGFRNPPPESEMAAVVIDCGGTARCGVYPRKKIPTINLTSVGQSGPLAQFITEDTYVSGVTTAHLSQIDEGFVEATTAVGSPGSSPFAASAGAASSGTSPAVALPESAQVSRGFIGLITSIGRAMGGVVNVLFNSGRKSIDTVIRNVLPFMAFVTMLIGVINSTGIGTGLAHLLSPLAGNIVGLVVLSAICGLPFLSPILGPGAVIAQVIGAAIIGPAIGNGTIPPQMALPALFAYDTQVGCDFVPVGMALGEAKPETIRIGVPAVLLSRQIMGPISVLIAWGASFAL
ncbi:PTS system glucitol/sorbitol-specific EIIB component [Paraburkholderia aspalathi]|uniref:PTS glucitol/sorbitol transporter subunit IIB n=1 Tax=Paraburkholderia aspalathi TaxID=1324617 RepID=UPI00190A605D|nr:PTS glucitol/sorbitol transporter subunit IIB [Paraburkholderia aspalathi]MBK3843910.1 PTS glucitol/sorbitol transporter subunit IIB [Paraburkholderia aspalathi]CAE6862301.1 PTS system glucitol/sorbitol-specific EIIB component [Paraburkholderia aspalathi]